MMVSLVVVVVLADWPPLGMQAELELELARRLGVSIRESHKSGELPKLTECQSARAHGWMFTRELQRQFAADTVDLLKALDYYHQGNE